MANNKSNSSKSKRRRNYGKNADNKKSFQSPANTSSNEGGAVEDSVTGTTAAGGNDVSWYTRYPNLVAAAANFPFPYKPGMKLPGGSLNTADISATPTLVDYSMDIPGVMVCDWMPSLGRSSTPTDPASILGKEMYARVRAAYSGTLRADAPDYVMYVMALDSVFAYIAWLKRLYRVLNVWSSDNFVVPDGLLHGMGLVDADILSLRADRVKLWQLINELVLQSRKFTCPGTLDIINRHYWLNDNVYTDAASIKSQFYMFNMRYTYKFSTNGVNPNDATLKVNGLVPNPMPWYRNGSGTSGTMAEQVLTPEKLYNYGIDLLEAIIEWDDSYTINGYLQRAYAGTPLFMVEELPMDAMFVPAFNPEVMIQIENSHCIPYGYSSNLNIANAWVLQNPLTNAIVSDPYGEITTANLTAIDAVNQYAFIGNNKINLTMRSDQPGPLENVIGSRMSAYAYEIEPVKTGDNVTSYIFHYDCASELPLGWRLVGSDDSQYDGTMDTMTIISTEAVPQDMAVLAVGDVTKLFPVMVSKVAAIQQFDWHPLINVVRRYKGSGTVFDPPAWTIVGDIHNVTTITSEELENLHKVCMFSEFNSFSMS